MATVGIIKTLIGTATATAPNGVQRNLNVGDKVEQNELISTGVLGAIEVEFNDGSVMTLGRNSQTVLSNEVFHFDEEQAESSSLAEQSVDVDNIQQAILEGQDPTQVTEATAAGAGVETSNEGVDFVQVAYENPQVTPEAGFDTTGISFTFEDAPIDDGVNNLTSLVSGDIPENNAPEVKELSTDTSEDKSITFTKADLLAGATDADQSDSLNIENVTLGSGGGKLVDNGNGTWTYTPVTNSDANAVINFNVTDGKASVANKMNVNVAAVADQPYLIVSAAKAVTESSKQTINLSNVSDTDKGFTVKAFGLDGKETDIGKWTNSTERGFGVNGQSSGNSTEIGSTASASERLQVQFANTVKSIDVKFAWLASIETAKFTFYLNGKVVGYGTMKGITDTIDGAFTLKPDSGSQFDRVDFSAPLNHVDDYLIHSITFDRVKSYSYKLNVESSLTDGDGSEALSKVTFSSLPDGVTFNGTHLISNKPLTGDVLNKIMASVSSTEQSNGDTATTKVNVKLEFDSLDGSHETADLSIKGTSKSETIIGGAGDDVIFGGAGNDTMTGGKGADQFVWKNADVGTAASPAKDVITDFNAAEGDVLNLSDLLSDPNEKNTIQGIENNGHLEIQISHEGKVVQTIVLNSVAVANDAAAVAQLNTLLANGSINDGI